MLKKMIASLTFVVVLLTSALPIFAEEVKFPPKYWEYFNGYVAARDAGNQDDILKFRQLMIDCFGNDQSANAVINKANSYSDMADIYYTRQQYEKAAEALTEYIKCAEYLTSTGAMDLKDSIKVRKVKLEHIKLNIQVYAETKNTTVVPYYNQKGEPRNGIYIGRVHSVDYANDDKDDNVVPLTENEGITSFYFEFGTENVKDFDWYIKPQDDKTRILHFAWNLIKENSGLGSVLSESSNTHIIDTLKYINSLESPTMLRIFGEMNVWEDLADAQKFKDAYVKIAKLARQYAPNTALIFSPNCTSNWNVDIADYYPGDEYVDWVGVSLYVQKYFSFANPIAGKDDIESYYYNGIYANPIVMLRDIVERYGSKKPIIVTEGGTVHTLAVNGKKQDLSGLSSEYMKQVYEYASMVFPQVKAAVYFDIDLKPESFLYSLAENNITKNAYFNSIKANPTVNTKLTTSKIAYVEAGKFNEATDSLNLATYAVFPNDGQTVVEYYVDGKLHTSTKEVPYKTSISASSLSDGSHKLEVVVKNGSYSKKLEYTVTKSAGNISCAILN